MKRQWLQAVSVVAALLLTSGSAWAADTRLAAYLPSESAPAATSTCPDPKAQLAKAAESAGVQINPTETVSVSKDGLTFVGSSIAGFENVPATRLPAGTDFGFMYLDAPGSGIPAGYYRLNAQASAQDVRVGDYRGSVDLIDASGKTVARVPAAMQTVSMEVPNPLPFARTTVDASFRQTNLIGGYPDRLTRWHHTIIIIYHCPNGTTIIIFIDVW